MDGVKYNTVVLAGSGRSGTTWLGSILDSYRRSEYFYEICQYPELDFHGPALMRKKYPLTFWWPARPRWAIHLERGILKSCVLTGVAKQYARRSLRIHRHPLFSKKPPTVYVFKIVRLFSFALDATALASRFGDRLALIHILRNPYAQLTSSMRVIAENPEPFQQHINDRLETVLRDARLSEFRDMAGDYSSASLMEQMALIWWISNEMMIRHLPPSTHRVLYEDLARDPFGEVEVLFSFLGWPMSGQTRRYVENSVNVDESDSGFFSLRKRPEEVVGRWRRDIDPGDYHRVRTLLAPCKLLRLWDEQDLALDECRRELCIP